MNWAEKMMNAILNKSRRVYLASPFFNVTQLKAIELVERILGTTGGSNLTVFSPRKSSESRQFALLGKEANLREHVAHKVYLRNVEELVDCDLVIAIIDDFDPGTIWEMGFATAIGKPVVSLSIRGYGCNLMLARSVVSHCRNTDQLRSLVAEYSRTKKILPFEKPETSE